MPTSRMLVVSGELAVERLIATANLHWDATMGAEPFNEGVNDFDG